MVEGEILGCFSNTPVAVSFSGDMILQDTDELVSDTFCPVKRHKLASKMGGQRVSGG